jgi:DNA invertase Pin-like site-specific DNA recombinase
MDHRGVDFVACDNPHANLTIHILAAVAQHEREMIAQRTKDALAARQAARRQPRWPKLEVAQEISRHRRKALAEERAANVVPIIRDAQRAGSRACAPSPRRSTLVVYGRRAAARGMRDALKRAEVRT